MSVAVLGSGAFGTALAITLGQKAPVTLWARDPAQAATMQATRINAGRLPDAMLPDGINVTNDLAAAVKADTLLLAIPTQKLRGFFIDAGALLATQRLVACCKGVELETGMSPVEVMRSVQPDALCAHLTGPSFAKDIAKGLPTALTLACADERTGLALQQTLSTATLRLYRTTDVVGAGLGGALKNVIAIACGAAIGAGLGESARAALMTRGNAEMQRLAVRKGAQPETLSGLSGFGDLVLTCTSDVSRNYRFGLSLGRQSEFDVATTVEGAATAQAVVQEAQRLGVDLPITHAVAALVDKKIDVKEAMDRLLSRSLKEE
ncbi:MAG: NAD(P)H-dependent glycerol-3-phosphate dehydrogenase [Pseudomonadota bacterium]